MSNRPNVLFVLADQLRATSIPLYGEHQIETPHLDRLTAEGVVFTNSIATCPVCTPYRAMLVTGRHPQTTGMIVNFARLRHDEIGIGDVFGRAGYRTGWIGKWHLHTGSFPAIDSVDYVPEGRDRMGFEHWRGYNFHSTYFDGWYNVDDWHNRRWEGYEAFALNKLAFEFVEADDGRPFCLFISPHQPHSTRGAFAPEEYYQRLPEKLQLPANVPAEMQEDSQQMYRHYLAMTIALDDMMGELLGYLERTGLAENTLLVFTSDHGSQVGAQGISPWMKMRPYEESLRVPMMARLPGVLSAGATNDTLIAPVDILPSLCGLCGIPVPRTVEGCDLSDAILGRPGASEQDALLTMNFTATFDWLLDGKEWRGVRTKTHNLNRWLDGRTELFDLEADPLEMQNLADDPASVKIREQLEKRLDELMAARGDALLPCHEYRSWHDNYRRVVRNAYGPLGDPEDTPDWSLLANEARDSC